MEKFISFEKLSKKKQRELNAKKRGSWHGLNPVTRKPENSNAYNRQKARKWSDDSMTVPFVSFIYCAGADGCTIRSCRKDRPASDFHRTPAPVLRQVDGR